MSKRVYLPQSPCQITPEENTREHQDTGQSRDGQSVAYPAPRRLPTGRCPCGAAHQGAARSTHPDGLRAGALRALGTEPVLSLCLAEGVPVARPGQPDLSAQRWSPREVDAQTEKALAGVGRGRPPGGGLGEGLGELGFVSGGLSAGARGRCTLS